MRSQMLVLVVMSLGLLAPACPPSPTPPQPPDVVDDAGVVDEEGRRPSTSASACANLAAVGCIEGRAPDCAAAIDRAVAQRITRVDVSCLSTKKTKAQLRACGFVTCP